jgi:hypothetical protein
MKIVKEFYNFKLIYRYSMNCPRLEQWQKKVALGPGKQRAETCFGLENRTKISKFINDYGTYCSPSYLIYGWIIAKHMNSRRNSYV